MLKSAAGATVRVGSGNGVEGLRLGMPAAPVGGSNGRAARPPAVGMGLSESRPGANGVVDTAGVASGVRGRARAGVVESNGLNGSKGKTPETEEDGSEGNA